MSRWMIEKSGTGIEKSGTGIEKSGTGIEKSGTGIEKSGTGIEKSGTGIRRLALACSMALMSVPAFAGTPAAEGFPHISVFGKQIVASWHFDGSVFSAVGDLSGSFGVMDLIEIRRPTSGGDLDVTGGGTGITGPGLEVTGGGTGLQVTGGGTGVKVTGGGTGLEVTGGGTGLLVTGGGTGVQVTGGGTGLLVTGGGTGVQVTGGGTGVQVTGGGTGLLVTGGGTGAEGVSITLPDGTGLQMEIQMGCGSAKVTILDATFAEVVSFDNVPVMGGAGFCGDGPGSGGGIDRGDLR